MHRKKQVIDSKDSECWGFVMQLIFRESNLIFWGIKTINLKTAADKTAADMAIDGRDDCPWLFTNYR